MTPAQYSDDNSNERAASAPSSPDIIDLTLAPVRKSIEVRASVEDAFEVFANDMDSWWPRTHHIGKSPMTRCVLEPRAGGRCYSEQEDGTECDWGSVLAWDPPSRLMIAWQITPTWQFEPDISRSSEVDVHFTSLGENLTRVDLEHRHFERLGEGGRAMRAGVDDPSGWNGLLTLYANQVHRS